MNGCEWNAEHASLVPRRHTVRSWNLEARSAEIDHARGTIFGSKCEQLAVVAPGEPGDRRIVRLARQHFGAVIDADEQNESVGVAGGDHRLLGMARYLFDVMFGWRQQLRRLAHRAVLRLERPQDDLVRARGHKPLAVGAPIERTHARAVALHAH